MTFSSGHITITTSERVTSYWCTRTMCVSVNTLLTPHPMLCLPFSHSFSQINLIIVYKANAAFNAAAVVRLW